VPIYTTASSALREGAPNTGEASPESKDHTTDPLAVSKQYSFPSLLPMKSLLPVLVSTGDDVGESEPIEILQRRRNCESIEYNLLSEL